MSLLARILAARSNRFPNPLAAGDTDFACRCSDHRDVCRETLKQWRADCGDEPSLSTDPAERASAVLLSCIRVYDILAKPEWDRFDLNRMAEHYPVALENDAFRSVMAGRVLQVELAVRAARRHLDVLRCPS